ncbi:MAG: enoyl-CoA hydratase-related protein [bacterium]
MSQFHKIRTQYLHDGEVLSLTLNAPKANVLDKEMMTELTQAVQAERQKPELKALVFQGEGEHFSFGASVPEHQKEQVAEMLQTFHQFFRTLIDIAKPTFAVVRGQCLGGGLELAAFCNWIFAAEDAAFGQPEIKLAVFPPVASLILPYRIGQSAADDLVLTGRSISAREALTLGLVHSVSAAPEANLDEFIVQHILPKSAVSLKFAVKSSRHEMHRAFLKNIGVVEKMYVEELMAAHDPNEGIRAFLEKRKPAWQNR